MNSIIHLQLLLFLQVLHRLCASALLCLTVMSYIGSVGVQLISVAAYRCLTYMCMVS